MGPPPFSDGNGPLGHPFDFFLLASMGPPPFGDGTRAELVPKLPAHVLASMGPPPFGDGTRAELVPKLPAHVLASMGPPPFGDGNSVACGRWPARSRRFNGATAFRRWKPGLLGRGLWTAGYASMGPPPFGDGNFFKPPSYSIHSSPLQWGHRLSAMETGTGSE